MVGLTLFSNRYIIEYIVKGEFYGRKKKGLEICIYVILCIGCGGTEIQGDTSTENDDEWQDEDMIWADSSLDTDADISDGPWRPDIENAGDYGWRESTEPWCPGASDRVNSYDIWSYIEKVYVLVTDYRDMPGTSDEMDHIYYNDGSGWYQYYEALTGTLFPEVMATCMRKIHGTNNGTLFTWGGSDPYCRLVRFDDETPHIEEYQAITIYAVSTNQVFMCAAWVGLLEYNGSSWTRVSAETERCLGNEMWANDELVLVAHDFGVVEIFNGTDWQTSDTGALSHIHTVWGFESNNVWAGTDDGVVVNYDGDSWTPVETPVSDDIKGMWGKDGILFMHTPNHLLQHDGVEVRILGYLPPPIEINAIWGNSETEVFLAITDEGHVTEDCGPEYLLWWDGTHFHWF